MFKSNLRFSSLFVLASFLSVPLSHAMNNEDGEIHKNPLLQKNLFDYIAGFVTDSKDQGSMALVNKTWNRAMKSQAEKVHKSIQEKMKTLKEVDQVFILDFFGDEAVDCQKHAHFNILKFLNAFTEDSEKPQIYRNLYKKLLNQSELSQFHRRTMMVNAVEFCLLKFDKLSSAYAKFSTDQMEVLGKYKEALIPEISVSGEYYKMYLGYYLNRLQSFSGEQLEVLGKYKILKQNMSYHGYYKPWLGGLQLFSAQKLEVLGKYKEALIPEMSDGEYYETYLGHYLNRLQSFSGEQLEVLGKYKILKQNMSYHGYYKPCLEIQKTFIPEKLESIGKNMGVLFKNVEDHKHPDFFKKELLNLTPKEIELFAQKKEKEINENK